MRFTHIHAYVSIIVSRQKRKAHLYILFVIYGINFGVNIFTDVAVAAAMVVEFTMTAITLHKGEVDPRELDRQRRQFEERIEKLERREERRLAAEAHTLEDNEQREIQRMKVGNSA